MNYPPDHLLHLLNLWKIMLKSQGSYSSSLDNELCYSSLKLQAPKLLLLVLFCCSVISMEMETQKVEWKNVIPSMSIGIFGEKYLDSNELGVK